MINSGYLWFFHFHGTDFNSGYPHLSQFCTCAGALGGAALVWFCSAHMMSEQDLLLLWSSGVGSQPWKTMISSKAWFLPSSKADGTFCSESIGQSQGWIFLPRGGSEGWVWALQALNRLFGSVCERSAGKITLRTASDGLDFLHVPSKCLLIWNWHDQGHERWICCSLFRKCTGFASLPLS